MADGSTYEVLTDDALLCCLQPLEGGADAHRLAITVAHILSRQSIPILVILEDLQWAFDFGASADDEADDERGGGEAVEDERPGPHM